MGIVELTQVGQELGISGGGEVDGNSLSSEPSGTTNPVDVLGGLGGEVVVDDEVDLLDVNTPAQQVGRDEDP